MDSSNNQEACTQNGHQIIQRIMLCEVKSKCQIYCCMRAKMHEGIGTSGFDLPYVSEDDLAPKLFGTEIQIVSTRCAQFWGQMGMCRLWIIKKFRGQKIIVYISRLSFFARVQCAHNHLRLSIMIQHRFKTFELIHRTFCAHIIVIRIEYITSCFSMIYEILSNNMIFLDIWISWKFPFVGEISKFRHIHTCRYVFYLSMYEQNRS